MTTNIYYVYLCSTSYSGSTLLARLMNAHPHVASVGELSNVIDRLFREGRIDEYLCSCGTEIEDCSFWMDVQRHCAQKGTPLDLHDFGTRLDTGLGPLANSLLFGASGRMLPLQYLVNLVLTRRIARVRSRVDRTLAVAECILAVGHADVFFDTSKNVGRAPFLFHRAETDFRLLHLTRDPRGFLNSVLKHKGDAAAPEEALSYWKRTHRSAMILRQILGAGACLLIHYEELCRDPQRVLQAIFQFLGLPNVDVVEEAKTHPHHIIGNAIRLRPFEGIHLDSSWKRELTVMQIKDSVCQVGTVAKSLGYG